MLEKKEFFDEWKTETPNSHERIRQLLIKFARKAHHYYHLEQTAKE